MKHLPCIKQYVAG